MPIELTHPWYLLALLVLPVVGWYFVRGLTDFSRWQRVSSLAARTLVIILLVGALCGLTWVQPSKDQYVVFVIDESSSIGDQAKPVIESFVERATAAAGKNKVAFVRFGAEPGAVTNDRTATVVANKQGTNIAAALEVARAAIPPSHVPKLVLLSDGNQTAGDAVRTALRGGVPVSAVPLPVRTEPEVQVSAVNVPAQIRDGEPFNVEVQVDSNHDDEGEIEVFRGAHKVVSQPVKIKAGTNAFKFRQQVSGDRLAEYTARIKGFKDKSLDNNTAKGLVFSSGKPRVLVVDSDPKQVKHLADALEVEGIKVDIRPVQGIPDRLSDLQNYELVILSNVPATSMSQRQMEYLRDYVQNLGGGLIMIGGDQAFGLGGYYKSKIEEILPVRSDFEKEKEKPSIAMVLVIDKSGSMGGDKMEMAKDAAKAAVELMGPKDQVGVIVFDGDFHWLADIQPASNKGQICDKISAVVADGGTVMGPPMEAALEQLQGKAAKLKHVIVLTDGISEPADFEGIAQNMAQSKITCSTVAVGTDCDFKTLQEIARIGNGRYYHSEDATNIPQIFAKETVTASKSAINEVPFTPIVNRASPALAGINFEAAPSLLGYVTTRPKPTSEVVLITENKGDPLLAWWRYGLGMTVAFTSDAKTRWAADWVSWPEYTKFWAQIVRHAMRKSDAKGAFVQMEHKDGKAKVTLDAILPDGSYLNDAVTKVTVLDPLGGERELTLTQTAPGRYAGEFPVDKSGSYHVLTKQWTQRDIDAERNQNKQAGMKEEWNRLPEQSKRASVAPTFDPQQRGLVLNYDNELRILPTNEALLKTVAESSGGVYGPEPEAVFAADARTASRPVPLWPYLLMAAAIVFLVDVALRRIDFDILLGRDKPPMKMVMAKR